MKKIIIKQNTTDLTDPTVACYLSSISEMSSLTTEEEAELARRIHLGGHAALEKLICANLRFVVSVAKQFQFRGLELADLIAEGNIGLCKAAERFDETRGFKFITFAVNYIKQAILDALAEKGRLIRLPHGQIAVSNRIKDITKRYQQEKHRPAELDEIVEELEMSPAQIRAIMRADSSAYSLDVTITKDCDASLCEFLDSLDDSYADSALEEESRKKVLDIILHSKLKERDIYVIRHTYGLDCEELSQQEIAERLGLSRESVRLIRDKAILKLRDKYLSKRLRLCC